MDGLQALVTNLAALVVALTGLAVLTRKLVVELHARDDKTDFRLDRLWEAHMLRGTVEVKRRQLVTEVSTDSEVKLMLLRPDVRAAYEPIALALKELRATMKDATVAKLAEAIEIKFGPWLSRHICEVIGVNEYGCLAMAAAVADEETLEKML